MQPENIFIVHPTVEQENALKAFKIEFEIATSDNLYNPAFVAKIKKSRQEFERGDFTRVEKSDLQTFMGLR